MDPALPQPPSTAPALPSGVSHHSILALSIGAAALVTFIVQLSFGVQVPVVILAINLGLAAGAYGVLVLHDPWIRDAGDVGILQFMGFVAIALLGRVWLGQTAQGFAILLEYSLSLAALAIATACILLRIFCTRFSPRRAALANAGLGGFAFCLLVVVLLANSTTRQSANLALLGLTCIIVPCLLGLQWWFARRLPWAPAKVWASSVALAIAGTQLFDGVLTYLAVEDPFGIAPDGYEEQIPVSRFILDRFGIGFPIAKWALGIIVASILARADFGLATHRVVLYLAILAAGMGPGLYTAAQLF